ncbi:MAG: maleylpyruvate isomerase N-terminal domain-containing protein [Candidatus Jorgensenbacteria bacterium]|nr:maleylpyruvate isomerase N-terminal domain-containing protein [Candidatus Jorgensenbacteria bacterium]
MDTVLFFKSLKPEDWAKKATSRWSVKDVLAHLVGWEKEVAEELKRTWGSSDEAWFMKTDAYDEFNEKVREFYHSYSPEQLIAELEKWQKALEGEIERIGELNIKSQPRMGWVFDEGGEPHFEHHINQVQNVLKG